MAEKECDSKEEAYNKCYFYFKYWKDKAKEYKHRAEVAERALDIACQTYDYCLDSISNCFHGRCYRYAPDCKGCLKTYSQEQAEKELREERKE